MNDYPGKWIAVIHRKTQIYWNRELKEYGISASEFPLLFEVYQREGITQDELSLMLALDKAAVTRTIQSLTEKGIVERRKDADDHRCNRIFLTEKGRALQEPINKARVQLSNRLMNQMSQEERQEFLHLLKMAIRSIDAAEDEPEIQMNPKMNPKKQVQSHPESKAGSADNQGKENM